MTAHRTGWFWLALFMAAFTVVVGTYMFWQGRLRAADCRHTEHVRAEQRQLLVDIVTDLGAEPSTVAVIEWRYDQLADPVTC